MSHSNGSGWSLSLTSKSPMIVATLPSERCDSDYGGYIDLRTHALRDTGSVEQISSPNGWTDDKPNDEGYLETTDFPLLIADPELAKLKPDVEAYCPSSNPATTTSPGSLTDSVQCYNYGAPVTVGFAPNTISSPSCSEANPWEYSAIPA